MKIFISHSSENKDYGNLLVKLLRDVGVKENEVVFTSNNAYGIPTSSNIFNWLKSQIKEKPYVLYLLSEEYYKSIACLNEMGAAWIIESKHTALFIPEFKTSSNSFQSGVLDSKELGFYIDDKERILTLIDILREDFEITSNSILKNQYLEEYIQNINKLKSKNPSIDVNEISDLKENKPIELERIVNSDNLYHTFLEKIRNNKLKKNELLLLSYIENTSRFKLKTGWQEEDEISNIIHWERANNIKDTLSNTYADVLNRLDLRGFTEVSAFTSSNNAKEVMLKIEISSNILDLPEDILEIFRNSVEESKIKSDFQEDDVPF